MMPRFRHNSRQVVDELLVLRLFLKVIGNSFIVM